MPHVEVLPNSAASVAPGWTYVVDTGYDPSKVAINPKNKKRAAAQAGGQRGENELSARQQTAITRRIAELERDNDPKQNIAIPGKPGMYACQPIRACANGVPRQRFQRHRTHGESYSTSDRSSTGLMTRKRNLRSNNKRQYLVVQPLGLEALRTLAGKAHSTRPHPRLQKRHQGILCLRRLLLRVQTLRMTMHCCLSIDQCPRH